VSIPGRGNSSKRPDGNPSGQVVSFTRGAADRIAKVVRTVERGDTGAEGLRFTRNTPPSVPLSVRPATFTGEWKVDTLRTVTFQNVTTTPNTAQVANLTFNLTPFGTATSYTCLIAKVTGPNTVATSEGTASWALIAAEEMPVRIASFTGAWSTSDTANKQITFRGISATANAINLFSDVADGPGTQPVAVASLGTSWYAIELPGSDRTFRVATFTGEWAVSSPKTVTLRGQTSTFSAINLIAKVPEACSGATATRDVLIAKDGTAWQYVTHERECEGQYPAAELDEGADCGSSLALISQGDGPQVLLNEQGCAKWWELYKQEVVTDVQWNNGIVVTKKDVWLFRDPGEPIEEVIISATECEED
jgi:hypothetical protein